MEPDSQIQAPPSFEALYHDARGRLQLPRVQFLQRYELCEDMAQALVDPSRERLMAMNLAEDLVLQRTRDALAAPDSGFSADEAHWVATRLAELLGWIWQDAMPMPPARGVRAPRLA